jgi:hypothetical protein
MKTKLNHGQKHILKLITRDRTQDGWAQVSKTLYETLSGSIPSELAVFEKLENGGRAKLTAEGQGLVNALEWL